MNYEFKKFKPFKSFKMLIASAVRLFHALQQTPELRQQIRNGLNDLNILNGLNALSYFAAFKIFHAFSRFSWRPPTIHFHSVSSKYFTPFLGRLPGLR